MSTRVSTLDPVSPAAGLPSGAALAPVDKPRFGALLRSEHIKFWSTRSPWWSLLLAAVLSIGFGMLVTGTSPVGENRIFFTMGGMQFAGAIILVMAAMAVTTEYRFGTIRTTFQASPNRARVLWTKAGLVAVIALVAGEVLAFATFFLARLVAKDDVLVLDSATAWRQVAGFGLVYGLTAIIGVGVGAIVRHTAGAISLLLVWSLIGESLFTFIPRVGDDIYRVLPFTAANQFTGDPEVSGVTDFLAPGLAIALVAGYALVILVAATIVIRRRDA